MPGTPGPRTGLATINPTGEAPSLLRATINAVITWLEGNAMLTSAGLLSSRPVSTPASPGISGRRYYATDTGVEYRDTGTDWIALGIELVTSLPASPYNGQIVDYLADAANGIIWRLRYRAASTSAYKWEAVSGSSPLLASVLTAETITGSGAYVDLATPGPQITVPLAGDYIASLACAVQPSATSSTANHIAGICIGGAASPPDTSYTAGSPGASTAPNQTHSRPDILIPSLASGSALKVRYNGQNTLGVTFSARTLSVRPRRVG